MSEERKQESLLSEKDAAARLGISRPALLKLRQRGQISHFRIGTRVLYTEAALNEFLSTVYKQRRGHEAEGATEVATDV